MQPSTHRLLLGSIGPLIALSESVIMSISPKASFMKDMLTSNGPRTRGVKPRVQNWLPSQEINDAVNCEEGCTVRPL